MGQSIYEPVNGKVEIFLPSTLGYEKVARNAAAAVAEEMGFSEDRIEDLKTAVAEVCMNAIEHGNKEDKTTSVTVLLEAGPNQLEVSVKDEGLTPMPAEFPKPGRPGEDNRGWGMFFIQQLMDKVEVSRLPVGGNQVRMVIYLEPEGGEGGEGDGKSDTKKE
ncbi:MAG TPA: ATP-binding protein [Aggregatilineales bacterium]|nr:ATP-binding protein [Anaerolineales bacterium]HRE47327.1 ATP-binding protein [Aggregatilineales bacterium]